MIQLTDLLLTLHGLKCWNIWEKLQFVFLSVDYFIILLEGCQCSCFSHTTSGM